MRQAIHPAIKNTGPEAEQADHSTPDYRLWQRPSVKTYPAEGLHSAFRKDLNWARALKRFARFYNSNVANNYAYKQWWKRAAAQTLDAFGALWPKREIAFPKDERLRVVVIRLDHLGDILCTLPFLKQLKMCAPSIHLTFLTTPAGRVLLRDVSEIDDWFVFEPAWFARDSRHQEWPLKTMRDVSAILSRRTFDVSIDLRGDIRHHVMMRWSHIPYRAGYGQTGGGFLMQHREPWDPKEHAVDKNLRFLSLFNCKAPLSKEDRSPVLPWRPKSDEEAWFSAVVGKTPYRIYNVDAGTSAKRWSPDYFAKLIAQMPAAEGKAVLVGQDTGLTQQFRSNTRDPRIINLVGKTSLPQLIILLQRARAVLSADSGPAHIAAALGVPVLVLWSGTSSPEIWRPRSEQTLVLQQPVPCQYCELTVCPVQGHPCMEKLTVERVLPIWLDIGKSSARL
jgi:ADP-heptose:LPS heptosyltransferase